jgi:nitrogen fixation-related uncharacterized protein
MDEATIALMIMSGLIFLIFLGFLIWGIVSGQFKNIEEAKYQLFKRDNTSTNKMNSDETGANSQGEKKC